MYIHIIHIIHSDSIDWLKSVYLANISGTYVGKDYPGAITMKIPFREAVARLRSEKWIYFRFISPAQGDTYIQTNHEDFLLYGNGVTTSALKFLGSEPKVLSTGEKWLFRR